MASEYRPTETVNIKEGSGDFLDNPLPFLQACYREAKKRNDDLRETNIENALFYEGMDKILEDRQNDPSVARSALFIPILKPAVDTIVAGPVNKLDQFDTVVSLRPANPKASEDELNQALGREKILNQQLRDSGYLSDGFKEHVLAAEIYRTPSTVKVSWEWYTDVRAVRKMPSLKEAVTAMVNMQMPKMRVEFVSERRGRPCIQWLYPDEFLYQPNVSSYRHDSTYTIHGAWIAYDELKSEAETRGWDKKKIDDWYNQKLADSGKYSTANPSISDEVEEGKGTPFDEGYRDGKCLVCETTVRVFNEAGMDEYWLAVTLGNEIIIKKPYRPYRAVGFPFVPITVNQIPGTIESLSSVDMGKPFQRLYNDLYNSFLDGTSYRMFPPLKAPKNLVFESQPKWSLGAIWRMNRPNELEPLIANPGPMPDITYLLQDCPARMRDALNAADIAQGFNANEYEKATATNYRAVGMATRSVPKNKLYGRALIEVAKMFVAMNQQFADDKIEWAMDFIVDCPALSNAKDEESEKQEAIMLFSQAMQDPIYQTPLGQVKLNNIRREVMLKFKRNDIDRFVPTNDEIKEIIGLQAQMQQAAMKKQMVTEQMAMETQMQPQIGGGDSGRTNSQRSN